MKKNINMELENIDGIFVIRYFENGDVLLGDEMGETHFLTKKELGVFIENRQQLINKENEVG